MISCVTYYIWRIMVKELLIIWQKSSGGTQDKNGWVPLLTGLNFVQKSKVNMVFDFSFAWTVVRFDWGSYHLLLLCPVQVHSLVVSASTVEGLWASYIHFVANRAGQLCHS